MAVSPAANETNLDGCDHAFFSQYREQSRPPEDFERWPQRWVLGVPDRCEYLKLPGSCRLDAPNIREHAYTAPADFGE